ncbi:MAG: HAD family hydrolase [Gemmataceae bacterium]
MEHHSERTSPASGFGVIWDLDGTLVDTGELHFEAWVKLASSRGWPFTREDFAATFGRRNPEIIRQLFGQDFDDQEIHQIGEEKEELYRAEASNGVALLPGVSHVLPELRRAGFRQIVGSSAPRKNIELLLKITGAGECLTDFVGSEDTDRGKPDPQVFLQAAERIAIGPEKCIVVEDAVAGVEAAKAGGMKAIAVTFVGHHSEDSLRRAGADLVVPTLEELTVAKCLELLGV